MVIEERKMVTTGKEEQRKIRVKRIYNEDGKDIKDVMKQYVKNIMSLNT